LFAVHQRRDRPKETQNVGIETRDSWSVRSMKIPTRCQLRMGARQEKRVGRVVIKNKSGGEDGRRWWCGKNKKKPVLFLKDGGGGQVKCKEQGGEA
jgi:hypothetical protein